jgi:transglutaminase-like putative cysteine protease
MGMMYTHSKDGGILATELIANYPLSNPDISTFTPRDASYLMRNYYMKANMLSCLRLVGAMTIMALAAPAALAACSITINSVYTCNASGVACTPAVGQAYGLRATWTVTGTPKAKYDVSFTIANKTSVMTGLPAAAGTYGGYFDWVIPLDDPIPYSLTVDSTNVTGNTNTAHKTVTGTFTPTPPSSAIVYSSPNTLSHTETFTVQWEPGVGKVTSGYMIMGVPTTDSFQEVVSSTASKGATAVTTEPSGEDVWQTVMGALTPTTSNHTWTMTTASTTIASCVAVNPTKLRAVTWAQIAAIPASLQVYTETDSLVEPSAASIVTFFNSVLPSNYKTKYTPYDAAKLIYLAVVKALTYVDPTPVGFNAVNVLAAKEGDCLGFSTVFASCMRHMGIPTRTICGWWTGSSQFHCMAEFNLPGCGWVVADSAEDKLWYDPTGTYACLFGVHTYLNTYYAVSRCNVHTTSEYSVTETQTGGYFYYGTATPTSSTSTTTSAVE